MAIKKKKHPQVVDKKQLRIIFARLADEAHSIKLNLPSGQVRARVLDEDDGAIFAAMRLEEIERHGIKANHVLSVVFYYEGKEHYGGIRVLGAGRYEKEEALRLQIPNMLSIRDDFGLTTFNLSPRIELTFTDLFKNFCNGLMVNLGSEGVDILNKQGSPTKELLAVDRDCDVAFSLDDISVYCQGTVLYINNVGEELIGIRFKNLDARLKSSIERWIAEKTMEKVARDQAWLQRHVSGDLKREKSAAAAALASVKEDVDPKAPRLKEDYPTVLHKAHGSETVLLLCRDPNMITRVNKCLKRKYGVLVSKGRFQNVKLILDYYRPDLVLVLATLDTISGFDLVATIREQIPIAPPLVILGEEDGTRSRLVAIDKGADYWCIEPFRPLAFFKNVDEILGASRRAREVQLARDAEAEAAMLAMLDDDEQAPESESGPEDMPALD